MEIVFHLKHDLKFSELEMILKQVLVEFGIDNVSMARITTLDWYGLNDSVSYLAHMDIAFDFFSPCHCSEFRIKVNIGSYSKYKNCWGEELFTHHEKHRVITAKCTEGAYSYIYKQREFLWPIGKEKK